MIIVSGIDGSGKTTLANYLANHYQIAGHLKTTSSNQEIFGLKDSQLALRYTLDFLRERMSAIEQMLSIQEAVFDHSVYEGLIRLKLMADLGIIHQNEAQQYFQNIIYRLQQLPVQRATKVNHLLIYLELSFEEMLVRKLTNDENKETLLHNSILYEFYQELHRRYQLWYCQYEGMPKLKLSACDYDFTKPKDIQMITQMIEQHWLKAEQHYALDTDRMIANVEKSIMQIS